MFFSSSLIRTLQIIIVLAITNSIHSSGGWSTAPLPTVPSGSSSVNIFGVTWLSPTDCLIIGSQLTTVSFTNILKSSDGGVSWSQVLRVTGSTSFYDISSRTINQVTHAVAVASNGVSHHSEDGGVSWIAGTTVSNAQMYGVVIAPTGKAFAVGMSSSTNRPTIYTSLRTSNFSSWASVGSTTLTTAPAGSRLNGISTYNGVNLLAVGMKLALFTSADSGDSWSAVSIASLCTDTNTGLYSVSYKSANYAYVGGTNGCMVRFDGTFWSSVASPFITGTSSFIFHSIAIATPSISFAVDSTNGQILRTVNGGVTWSRDVKTGSGVSLYSIGIYDYSIAVAGGDLSMGSVYVRSQEPTSQPSTQPSSNPSAQPVSSPTDQPSSQPSSNPTMFPFSHPSGQPSVSPSCQPSSQPSALPSLQPFSLPTTQPSDRPSSQPSSQPSDQPSTQPSGVPSRQPTVQPSARPSSQPSAIPTMQPSERPSCQPTAQPSVSPSSQPSGYPTGQPTWHPTISKPTSEPTGRLLDGNWTAVSRVFNETTYQFFDVKCADTIHCVMVGYNYEITNSRYVGVIARTAQGGVRRSAWRIALSLPYLTFQALSYREKPQPCFITVDQRGGIYTSTDNGVTWINSFNLTGAAGHSTNFSEKIANSLSHGDQGYAFVVGQNTLYRNVQSGIYSDWATVRTLGAQNLLDVSTHDGRVSIVVGEGGVVYRCSYNGFMVGDCALIDHQLTSTDLYNVVFCQYGSAMALGVDGSVLRSANEGYEWTMLKIKVAPWPYSVFGHNLVVLTNSVGYIVDVTGHLITTINGGRRWENETFIAAEVQLPVFCLTFYSTSVAIMGDSRGGVYVKRPIPTSAPSSHPSSQPSSQPSRQPVMRPSGQPSRQPTNQPTGQPSRRPSSQPTRQPQSRPSAQPSKMPTSQPSRQPTSHPSDQPSSQPSLQPSAQPSFQPSALPTSQPSACPSMQPSSQPIGNPSSQPSSCPTFSPSKIPSCQPTGQPSRRPSSQPSKAPTTQPSSRPSNQPSAQPTSQPSQQPSSQPTRQPISRPSSQPSRRPTSQPSTQPTRQPTGQPSKAPTSQPSYQPSRKPSSQPTKCPTTQPTGQPSRQPSSRPSSQPTRQPTGQPSRQPSSQPTGQPSRQPSSRPSSQPTVQPSNQPSSQPSAWPTGQPSGQPTSIPTMQPSAQPTLQPSAQPTTIPSAQPSTQPSKNPTAQPSSIPTRQPSTCPSSQPSSQPSRQPTGQPSRQPSSQPSRQPTAQPSGIPSAQPSCQPSNCPSMQPTTIPSNQPSTQPSAQPTVVPTMQPSRQPTTQPTGQPSRKPSSQPSGQPSRQPSAQPSRQPTSQPSFQPSNQPSSQPSVQPTTQPTGQPSRQPSSQPSGQPTTQPTFQPSSQPSSQPSAQPSRQPTSQPSRQPTTQPTSQPTNQPTSIPTRQPTIQPSQQPTTSPTTQPSNNPTGQPSRQPTSQPLSVPSSQPSTQPSSQPSKSPTTQPTVQPSRQPTSQPSGQPSTQPSSQPTVQPTTQPTGQPSRQPSSQPSGQPTRQPSAQPSSQPSIQPSSQPTGQPTTIPTTQPSIQPTSQPSIQPTTIPTMQPSTQPTGQPTTIPTTQPTSQPSRQPSAQPSRQPTTQPTGQPSRQPSSQPSRQPTTQPSGQPSRQPSNQPTGTPTRQPSSQPSKSPTTQPSVQPSRQPSAQPSIQPSAQPSMQPSTQPSSQPSSSPSCQPSSQPSRQPSAQPSSIPSRQPSGQPSAQPLSRPSAQPSRQPSSRPSSQPSRVPTTRPTGQPSRTPTSQPSQQPSVQPTAQPSNRPSGQPTGQPINRPSSQPSVQPSTQPSGQPSRNPSSQPSSQPTRQPTGQPISSPTSAPSTQPTGSPSRQPTSVPTMRPSGQPSEQPSTQPSVQPSTQPTSSPSTQPSVQPSSQPTSRPSAQPSRQPSDQPTTQPSTQPSVQPSFQPTGQPSTHPTSQPISAPSTQPTGQPSRAPSSQPSMQPSSQPSRSPSSQPTIQPTGQPSRSPSSQPSHQPTAQPTSVPSTAYPTSLPSSQPSTSPSAQPSVSPSLATLFAFAFNVTQGIQGTSRARFLADSSAATTAITMTVTDLVPSITHTNVRIVWVRDSPDVFSRRLEGVALHEPEYSQFGTMAVGTAGVNVLYTITYVPTSRDNHDQNVEYSRIVSALTSGVQSRRFNSTLHSNAVVYNAVSLLNSAVPPTALLNISERLVAVFIRSPMPTSQPSSQPSAQPASHPSSLPSSQPIGEPTGQPTCKPSSEPTARPTITLGTRYTMLLEALIKRYTPSEAHLRNVFYDVVARNAQVFDTCTLWSAFLHDNVHYSASIGSKRVTAVQLLQQEQHLLPTVVRCEVPELAMDIAGELATRQGAQLRGKNSIYCDGHEWTVNSCAGSSPAANSAAICVDCVDPCSALFCAPYSNSSLPPNVNANFSTGYVTLSPCVGATYDYAQCPVQDGLSRILSFELASQEGGVYSVFYSLLTLFVVVLLVVMGYERRVYSTQRKVKDHRTRKSDGALISLDVPAREGGDGAATQISVDLLSLSAIYPPSTPVRPSNQSDRRLERPAASSSVYNGANPSLQSDNVKPSTAMLSHLQSILRFTYFSPRIETTAGSSAPLALASSASISIRERIMTGIYPFHYLATAYQSSLATSRSLRLKYHMLAFHRVIWVLFFMSVFFNAQFIADDGTCAAFNSPSECHGPRTIFSRSVRQCEWIGSSGEDVLTLTTADSSSQLFVPQCVWSNYAITMDIFFRLLLVTALIASVSRHCLQNDFIEQLLFRSAASAYCSNVLLVVLQKGIVRHRLLYLRAKFRAALRYARRTVYWVCTPFRKAPAESAEEEEDDYWASSPPLASHNVVLSKDEGSATVHPLDSILVRPLSAEPATIVVGGQVVGADDAEEAGSVKSRKSNRPRSAAAAAEGEDLMAAPESGSVKSNRPQSAVSQKSNRPMSAASSKSNRPRSAVSFDEAQAPRSSSAKSNRPRTALAVEQNTVSESVAIQIGSESSLLLNDFKTHLFSHRATAMPNERDCVHFDEQWGLNQAEGRLFGVASANDEVEVRSSSRLCGSCCGRGASLDPEILVADELVCVCSESNQMNQCLVSWADRRKSFVERKRKRKHSTLEPLEDSIGKSVFLLFLLDQVGRDSYCAMSLQRMLYDAVFFQAQPPTTTLLTKAYLLGLLLLDAVLMFYCIQYTKEKPLVLLYTWLVLAILAVLVDSVLIEGAELLWCKVVTPFVIDAEVSAAVDLLISLIGAYQATADSNAKDSLAPHPSRRMRTQALDVFSDRPFSVSHYFALSDLVARKYHTLPHSAVVASLRDPLPPAYLSRMCGYDKAAIAAANATHEEEDSTAYALMTNSGRWAANWVKRVSHNAVLWMSARLPTELQRLLVSGCTLFLVFVLYCIAKEAIHSEATGAVSVVLVGGVIVLLALWIARNLCPTRTNASRVSEAPPETTSNLLEDPQSVDAANNHGDAAVLSVQHPHHSSAAEQEEYGLSDSDCEANSADSDDDDSSAGSEHSGDEDGLGEIPARSQQYNNLHSSKLHSARLGSGGGSSRDREEEEEKSVYEDSSVLSASDHV